MSKANEFLKNIREYEFSKERRWLVDGNTGEVLDSSDVRDDTYFGSNVTIDIAKQLGKNVIDIHTHPDNSFPSPEDWAMLFWGHAKQVRVILNNGMVVELTKPASLRMTPRGIKDKWQKIENDIFDSGRSRELTVEEIIVEINQRLSSETSVNIVTKNILDYKNEPWANEIPGI